MGYDDLMGTIPTVGAKWNYIAQNTTIILGLIGSLVMVMLNIKKLRSNREDNHTVSLVLSMYGLIMFTFLASWNLNNNPMDKWQKTHLTTYVNELDDFIIGSNHIEQIRLNVETNTAKVKLLDKNISFKEDIVVNYIEEQEQPYLTYKQLANDVVVEGSVLLKKEDFLQPVLHISQNMDIDLKEKE